MSDFAGSPPASSGSNIVQQAQSLAQQLQDAPTPEARGPVLERMGSLTTMITTTVSQSGLPPAATSQLHEQAQSIQQATAPVDEVEPEEEKKSLPATFDFDSFQGDSLGTPAPRGTPAPPLEVKEQRSLPEVVPDNCPICEDPFDFTTETYRCPNVGAPKHGGIAQIVHAGCRTSAGRCGACGEALGPGQIVTSRDDLPARTAGGGGKVVMVKGWKGAGVGQPPSTKLCYAAAVATAYTILTGKPMTAEEAAHHYAMLSNYVFGWCHNYRSVFNSIKLTLDSSADVSDVLAKMAQMTSSHEAQGAYNDLRGQQGQIDPSTVGLADAEFIEPADLTDQRVRSSVDAGYVIILGDSFHCTVLVGYEEHSNGSLEVLICNPDFPALLGRDTTDSLRAGHGTEFRIVRRG